MLGEACALGAALTWAASIILFKRSEAISPHGLNMFKNTVALALLAATMPLLGETVTLDRPPMEWATLAASGVLGIAVADTLFFMALRRLGPARAAVVDTTYTPFVVAISALWLREPLGLAFLAGTALVVGGVALATVEPKGFTPISRRTWGEGVGLGVTGILALAVGVTLSKPILAERPLLDVMVVRLVAGLLGQLVWISLTERPREAFAAFRPSRLWARLLPAAFLSTYMAMLLWLGGFKWANASTAAVLNQSSTIWTLLLARVFLGEPMYPARAVGGLIAIGGVAVILTWG